ncbi:MULTISPECIES: hypothetical protein [Staphylococcus]|uniref:hypothetical protein n=1 Tax=Staphylococcus TaxID=1279 RepID=UPI00114E8F5D|nr:MULTISPECIES: hypothetical protein [Staphylococcus]
MINIKQFSRELDLIKRNMSLKSDLEEKLNEDKDKEDISLIVNLITKYKFLKLKQEKGHKLTESEMELKDTAKQLIEKKKLFRLLEENITIDNDSDNQESIEIQVFNSAVAKFINTITYDKSKEIEDEIQIIYKNALYNLCTIVEKFFGMLLKDYYLNYNSSHSFLKEQLTYKELLAIDSIEESKTYLIERYTQNLFYKKSNEWYDKILQSLNFNSQDIDYNGKCKNLLSEMFYLRNLFIHADGEVNDLFLMNTNSFQEYSKGDKIILEESTIKNYEHNVFQIIVLMYWHYIYKVYKNDKKELDYYTSKLNTVLLNKIKRKYPVTPYLYDKIENVGNKISLEMRSIATINKLIYYYYFDSKIFEREIVKFDSSALTDEFKLSEAILLKEEDDIIEYLEKLLYNKEEKIFDFYNLPIIKIAKENHEKVNDLLEKQLAKIFDQEED